MRCGYARTGIWDHHDAEYAYTGYRIRGTGYGHGSAYNIAPPPLPELEADCENVEAIGTPSGRQEGGKLPVPLLF